MKKRTRNFLGILATATITLLSFAVFLTTATESFFYAAEIEIPVATTTREAPSSAERGVGYGIPVKLSIPSLEINADVKEVGINTKGNMAAPKNFGDVGWYKHGTVPGEIGSAVMAGHLDNGLALAGVFERLAELRPGDEMYVVTEKGENLHFVVSYTETYPHDAVPVETLFNRADQVRLNLVTCVGTWLPGKKTYDERLVVYAVRQ